MTICDIRIEPDTRRHRSVVGAAQLTAAVVDGAALSTIVVHATQHVGLSSAAIGFALAAAAAAALGTAVPLGAIADHLGLRKSATLYGLGSVIALTGYALADSLVEYALAAVFFTIAQAASGSVRHALAVQGAAPATRLGIRATMHTVLNVGFGLGTALGGAVAAVGSDTAFRTMYAVAALVAAGTAASTLLLPAQESRTRDAERPRVLTALRDRRFATATALASVIQLTMPVLSVLLPVWLLTRTDTPLWVPSVALAVNAVLVIAAQKPWAARVTSPSSAARSAHVAGACVLVSCVLMAISATEFAPTVGVVIAAVVLLTVAEIAGGAATWFVALGDVPADAEGRYQSTFSMSASAARIVGPAAALPLVTGFMFGWMVLGLVMAAACVGIATLASPRRSDDVAPSA